MRESMTNGITRFFFVLETSCVAVIVCMRFNAFVCIFYSKKRFLYNKTTTTTSFVSVSFSSKTPCISFLCILPFHYLKAHFFTECTRCTTSFLFQDVSIKVSMKYLCIRTFQTSQVPCCLPFHHLLFSIMSPSSASRWNMRAATILPSPNSLALCTGRSAFTKVPQQFGCPFTQGCE